MNQIKPVRIQRSRQKKQVSPNGLPIVYVGRPTKWGNPFKVVDIRPGIFSVKINSRENEELKKSLAIILTNQCHLEYSSKNAAMQDCICCYEIWLEQKIKVETSFLDELKGKNISCWCPVNSHKCHADILLELANK